MKSLKVTTKVTGNATTEVYVGKRLIGTLHHVPGLGYYCRRGDYTRIDHDPAKGAYLKTPDVAVKRLLQAERYL